MDWDALRSQGDRKAESHLFSNSRGCPDSHQGQDYLGFVLRRYRYKVPVGYGPCREGDFTRKSNMAPGLPNIGYLSHNHLRYKILATYNQTWFMRRDRGDYEDRLPSITTTCVRQYYMHLMVLTSQDHTTSLLRRLALKVFHRRAFLATTSTTRAMAATTKERNTFKSWISGAQES